MSGFDQNEHLEGDFEYTREWLYESMHDAGLDGVTSKELNLLTKETGGKWSGRLSKMHEREDAFMLVEKRNGYRLYVLPEFVNGRTIKERIGNAA